ncbi:hypothetical protein GJR96_07245 [Haloferax sp. MBLA0076]|uniref:DUF1102 domain-containing protein n=1 Tax=Haloferax litoreum TaxID=2666140 RepID=A0A6A8GJ65_9EURY|nr:MULTISPECIES: hypothetical protein [Haloferax]KAB1193251.1 hypothetical protein Hfx1148_07240 [Haloferax sp. CBA1148]MRX21750.1 hypothetical protein [Haloferax litoreum]
MTINRRNVLLGLGAIVGGGGALIGTGAFSSVSAARTVSVSTAGDGNAFLQIDSSSGYVTDDTPNDGTDTFTINFDPDGDGSTASGFNKNAVTTIKDALTITNNAVANSDGGTTPDIQLSLSDPDQTGSSGSASVTISNTDGTEEIVVTFYLGQNTTADDGTTSYIDDGRTPILGSGESANVDVKIDTTGNASAPSTDGELTIVAEQA